MRTLDLDDVAFRPVDEAPLLVGEVSGVTPQPPHTRYVREAGPR